MHKSDKCRQHSACLMNLWKEGGKEVYPHEAEGVKRENVGMMNGYNTVKVMGFLFKFCEDLISWAQLRKMPHKQR